MNCPKCGGSNHELATFCSNCGSKLVVIKETNYNAHVKNISIFFFVLLAYIIVLHVADFVDSYQGILIVDSIFALIVILFFLLNFRANLRLFIFKRLRPKIILLILILAPILAFLVNVFADFLNQQVLNQTDIIYYNQFANSPAPWLFSIISISLFPAIFEEIAFRGILFDQSYRVAGLKPTIFITAILFTILHLSLISALWLFPMGLLFGYLRARYRTILYGVIAHFAYNTSIVILEFVMS